MEWASTGRGRGRGIVSGGERGQGLVGGSALRESGELMGAQGMLAMKAGGRERVQARRIFFKQLLGMERKGLQSKVGVNLPMPPPPNGY